MLVSVRVCQLDQSRSRYRDVSSATGHVSRSGTSAIISQVVADAGMSVKPVAGHQANQRKGRSCWVSRRLAEVEER